MRTNRINRPNAKEIWPMRQMVESYGNVNPVLNEGFFKPSSRGV
jgi:hypothetical protein